MRWDSALRTEWLEYICLHPDRKPSIHHMTFEEIDRIKSTFHNWLLVVEGTTQTNRLFYNRLSHSTMYRLLSVLLLYFLVNVVDSVVKMRWPLKLWTFHQT